MTDPPTLPFDEGEEWRPVVGWEGFYDVSSLGRVRSLPRRLIDGRRIKGRVLRQHLAARGYRHVTLSADGRNRPVAVHILVATAFAGAPKPGQEVRHLDDHRLNNVASNLVWGTRAENIRDRRTNGIMYQLNRTHCINKHEWTPANTIFSYRADGSVRQRLCRECREARNERRRAQRKEKRAEAA